MVTETKPEVEEMVEGSDEELTVEEVERRLAERNASYREEMKALRARKRALAKEEADADVNEAKRKIFDFIEETLAEVLPEEKREYILFKIDRREGKDLQTATVKPRVKPRGEKSE